jgi:ubiquinone/menaquinone biosynthesis C-methylase UbiE
MNSPRRRSTRHGGAANSATAFLLDQRRRDVQRLLSRHGFDDLGGRSILELGCGSGGVLFECLSLGAARQHLHGTDLLPDRLGAARVRLPHVHLTCADGQRLPYKSEAFDVVLQYTVFTSVLDDEVRAGLAREMLRVLRRPGLILWYDFWLNPTNRQTRGIRAAEIRRLFPGCRHDFRRITLAPPLARWLVPVSRLLSSALERLWVLNTHYLVAIRPETPDGSTVP